MEDEVRWINLLKKEETEILNISYRDFGQIKVEKKEENVFIIFVDVFAVTNLSFEVYSMDDVDKAVKKLKSEIEDLYSKISEFEEEDLEKWINKFIKLLEKF